MAWTSSGSVNSTAPYQSWWILSYNASQPQTANQRAIQSSPFQVLSIQFTQIDQFTFIYDIPGNAHATTFGGEIILTRGIGEPGTPSSTLGPDFGTKYAPDGNARYFVKTSEEMRGANVNYNIFKFYDVGVIVNGVPKALLTLETPRYQIPETRGDIRIMCQLIPRAPRMDQPGTLRPANDMVWKHGMSVEAVSRLGRPGDPHWDRARVQLDRDVGAIRRELGRRVDAVDMEVSHDATERALSYASRTTTKPPFIKCEELTPTQLADLQEDEFEMCILCQDTIRENETSMKCINCEAWFHYNYVPDPASTEPKCRGVYDTCLDRSFRLKSCPACAFSWTPYSHEPGTDIVTETKRLRGMTHNGKKFMFRRGKVPNFKAYVKKCPSLKLGGKHKSKKHKSRKHKSKKHKN